MFWKKIETISKNHKAFKNGLITKEELEAKIPQGWKIDHLSPHLVVFNWHTKEYITIK